LDCILHIKFCVNAVVVALSFFNFDQFEEITDILVDGEFLMKALESKIFVKDDLLAEGVTPSNSKIGSPVGGILGILSSIISTNIT
jgi:hypothetical protein